MLDIKFVRENPDVVKQNIKSVARHSRKQMTFVLFVRKIQR